MKIAHISDLHFFHFSWHPVTFFSKRILASMNYLCFRRKVFNHKQLFSLVDLFVKEGVDLVIISGDLTTTGHKKELKQAQKFLKLFAGHNIKTLVIPGNHDFYLKHDEKKKTFYQFFQNDPDDLQSAKVEKGPLVDNWWYLALDTTFASSPLSSEGLFTEQISEQIVRTLQQIPKEAHILCINHFPLFAPDGPRRALVGREKLCELIKEYPQIKLYLHGHTHCHSIADLRSGHLPIIFDAGCTSYAEQGSFNMLELGKDAILVDVYNFSNAQWQKSEHREFTLAPHKVT
jgi:3',5'-cyclic AMP phosphodiesterase CpdA